MRVLARSSSRSIGPSAHDGDRIRTEHKLPQSLRIAVFTPLFPTLSETFVLSQITGLIDLGHKVTILAYAPAKDPLHHPAVSEYSLLSKTHFLQTPRGRRRRLLRLGVNLANAQPRMAPMTLVRSLNIARYNGAASNLSLACQASALAAAPASFDAILCHHGTAGRTLTMLREIGALSGRLLTFFHGADVATVLRKDPHSFRSLFATGDLFLPISDRWRCELIKHGCDPARTKVHRMGVDLQRFPYQPRYRRRDEPLRILTIGRLVEKKGIADALEAIAKLRLQVPDLAYAVVGDGPLRSELEAYAAALELGDVARFLGWRDQSETPGLMHAHHILLAPSRTAANGDQEGIPVTIMEAMATGMPVVSTFHSGIPELIENEVSGLLVEERNLGAISEALCQLAKSPSLGKQLGLAATERIARDYDIKKLNAALASLCSSVQS